MKIKNLTMLFEKNIAACFRAKDSCHSKSCCPYSMLLPCISSRTLLCHCSFSRTTQCWKNNIVAFPWLKFRCHQLQEKPLPTATPNMPELFVLSGHSIQYLFLYSSLPQPIDLMNTRWPERFTYFDCNLIMWEAMWICGVFLYINCFISWLVDHKMAPKRWCLHHFTAI